MMRKRRREKGRGKGKGRFPAAQVGGCPTKLDQRQPTPTNINKHRQRSGRRSWTETSSVRPRGPLSPPGTPGDLTAARSHPGGPSQPLGRRRAGRMVQGRSIAAYPAGGPTYPAPPSPRANGWPGGRESRPAACAAVGCPPGPRSRGAAVLARALCGRESIFLFSHTNEFCGKSKVAPEAGVAWIGLKVGRRVCERGQQRKQLPARCSSPQGRPQRAQRLCRFAGWPAHPGNRAPNTCTLSCRDIPRSSPRRYLETSCPRAQQSWSRRVDWIDPTPTKPAALCARTAYWGCLEAAGGVTPSLRRRMGSVGDWPLASPTTRAAGDSPRAVDAEWEKLRDGSSSWGP
jgi:hypothetical protein